MSDFDPKYLYAPFLYGMPTEVVSAVVTRFFALGFELGGVDRPEKDRMPWYFFDGQPALGSQIQAGWDVARNEVLLDRPDFAEHLEA